MASKLSLRNSIFRPHLAAMSLAMSYSMPLLIASGSTSAFVVPQKFGPGRLVTTLRTPAFTGLQSTVPPPPPPAVVVAAAAVVVAPDVLLLLLLSLPHATASRPAA